MSESSITIHGNGSSSTPPPASSTVFDGEGFYGSEEPVSSDSDLEQTRAVVDSYVEENPGGQERLIPLLHRIQGEIGFLPHEVQEYVAKKLDMSPIQVFGVVSFYHFFTTVPRGRFQLKVCMGTACFVRQAEALIETLETELGMDLGGISADGMFNLDQVRCIGACGLAPAVMIGDEVHGTLNQTRVRNLVRKLRKLAEAKESESS